MADSGRERKKSTYALTFMVKTATAMCGETEQQRLKNQEV
jgi:hypothetical protein